MNSYDVVIIGGGAAGLSAALVLSRARRRVLVVDSGAPRNAPAAQMHGFLSRDGMPPGDLLAAGREEVRGYGGTIRPGAVSPRSGRARRSSTSCSLTASGCRRAACSWRPVCATSCPTSPGLRERWAQDVLHCPYCHGWEVRDQPLGVLWNGPETVRYAQIVRQWTDDLVLFAPADTLTTVQRSQLAARAIGVVEGAVDEILVEDDHLTGVRVDDRVIARAAVFVPPRFIPNNDVLTGIGCDFDDQGWVVIGANGVTSVPGVWVAGNVANPRAQVITAAGEGSAAAIAINADLVDEDVAGAVRHLDQG